MLDVKRNLTTMTDFYELTMSAGYLDEGYKDKIAVFDMFFSARCRTAAVTPLWPAWSSLSTQWTA